MESQGFLGKNLGKYFNLGAPKKGNDALEHCGQPNGHHDYGDNGLPDQRPEHQPFYEQTENHGKDHGDEKGPYKGNLHICYHPETNVRSHENKLALGEVDYAGGLVYQHEPQGHQGVDAANDQTGDYKLTKMKQSRTHWSSLERRAQSAKRIAFGHLNSRQALCALRLAIIFQKSSSTRKPVLLPHTPLETSRSVPAGWFSKWPFCHPDSGSQTRCPSFLAHCKDLRSPWHTSH